MAKIKNKLSEYERLIGQRTTSAHISANQLKLAIDTHLDALTIRQREAFIEYVLMRSDALRPKVRDAKDSREWLDFVKLRASALSVIEA